MQWEDALKISTLVVASLGGGGAIVVGFEQFLGAKWLQDWKGDIDAELQRLDAALKHRNFLLQRFAEFELEAITESWRAARACLPLINATRPHDSGTDEAVLQANYAQLSEGHNRLIDVIGRHELFLARAVVDTLDAIGRVIRLELSNIQHEGHFRGRWWDQGEANRNEFRRLCDALLVQVRQRAQELRAQVSEEDHQR